MSSQRGLNQEELSAIAEFRGSALFTEREKIALEYAEEMCNTPVSVPDQLFGRLRRVFTEDEILELTATIALENFRARFNHALQIESDQLYSSSVPRQTRTEKTSRPA